MSDSIDKYGFIAPIVVRKQDGIYMIVVGENRYRAAKKSGIKELECILTEADDVKAREMQFVENYHRRDIPLWEQWEAWDKYIKQTSISVREFEKRSGIPEKTLRDGLNCLHDLRPGTQENVKSGKLQFRVAREVVKIKDTKRQNEVASLFVKDNDTDPEPSDYAPKIVKMAIEEPDIPATDIARCVKFGLPKPPKQKTKRTNQLDINEVMKAFDASINKLSILYEHRKLNAENLKQWLPLLLDSKKLIANIIDYFGEEDEK